MNYIDLFHFARSKILYRFYVLLFIYNARLNCTGLQEINALSSFFFSETDSVGELHFFAGNRIVSV